MTLYSLVLFIHVTAVLVLSAVLSFEVLSLFHLRSATAPAEAQPWIEPVPRLRLFAVGSLLVILFTGIYLAIPLSAPGKAWPKVAVAALLLMAPFGALTGGRMRAIRRAYASEKATSTDLIGRLRDPFLKISLCIRIAVFLGIFLLVNAKPALWGSVSIMGASVVLGLLVSFLSSRHSESLSAPSAGLGD